jgi:hypothetical protein
MSLRDMAKDAEIIEAVAEAIYRHSGGLTDDECQVALGHPRKLWKTDAPWDSNPEELCEWERDEYRMMAEAAIDALLSSWEAYY